MRRLTSRFKKQIQIRSGRGPWPRGFAFVEFALVLPLLIGLAAGIIELGIALYDKSVLTNAAREGARYAVLRREGTVTDAQRAEFARQRATQYAERELITFRPGSSSGPVSVVATPESLGTGQTGLRVRVSYEYQGFLLGPFFLVTLRQPLMLISEVVMRNE